MVAWQQTAAAAPIDSLPPSLPTWVWYVQPVAAAAAAAAVVVDPDLVLRKGTLKMKHNTLAGGKRSSDRAWKTLFCVLRPSSLLMFKSDKDFVRRPVLPCSFRFQAADLLESSSKICTALLWGAELKPTKSRSRPCVESETSRASRPSGDAVISILILTPRILPRPGLAP